MSFVRLGVSHLLSTTPVRLSCFRASLHTSCRPKQKAVEQNNPEEGDANAQPAGDEIPEGDMLAFNHVIKKKGLFKPQHSIDTQIKYMNSKAFYDAYGGLSIFMWYKRNYKGQYLFQPKPRLYCITKENKFNTNNPCPVCRDEYLFFHYKNPALIEQFLYEGTDKPRPLLRTGLCREQYVLLQAALLKAKEMGTLTFTVPFRNFDYTEFFPGYNGPAHRNVNAAAGSLAELRPQPLLNYPTHKADNHTDWDEWWTRWDTFARKGK